MGETTTVEQLHREVRDHLLRRIEAVEVHAQPFTHFFVTDLLPEPIYRELLDALPEVSAYNLYGKYDVDSRPTRHRMGLTTRALADSPPAARGLWLGVRAGIGCPEVKRAVFGRLREGLAFRYGVAPDDVADIPGFPLPELYRETAGYEKRPHTDTRSKIVTMQISLAHDESQADLGTAFYRLSANPLAKRSASKLFTIVKQIPFLPNSAYAFVVLNTLTRRSWHGRERLRDDCGVRNSILHIYYGDPANADRELVESFYARDAAALEEAAA